MESKSEVKMSNSDDRIGELKAFDGVKGLVDQGLTKVPTLFHHPPDKFPIASDTENTTIPVIDLEGIAKDPMKREQVVSRIREACETWGFFQVVNHGIPLSVLDGMKDGIRRFFEQDVEVKKEFYTRDGKKPFFYYGNFDLYGSGSSPLKWRDSFGCHLAPRILNPQDFPEVCRDIILEYRTNIMKLGIILFELLSETLKLHSNYLRDMELGCTDSISCAAHYYPACPEPELTMGTVKHSDGSFLTVLLQNYIDGLQIFHKDKWINVQSVPETLVVNVGDFLQILTNGRFKSVQHRVLSNLIGPRISFACFFGYSVPPTSKLLSPIKELLSENNPPRFKEITIAEYLANIRVKGVGNNSIEDYRIKVEKF